MQLIIWGLIGAFGASIGSFLNVVIYRGPALWGLVDVERSRGSFVHPRSQCPDCNRTIPPWRLIPIFSYIVLRGKCADCRSPISIRYPMVETLGAGAALISASLFGLTLAGVFSALLLWALIALSFIDWETGFLPDRITLPLIVIGISANSIDTFTPLMDAALGALIGGLAFWAINEFWRRFRGYEGLGLGDAKLLAALGAWCGVYALPIVILLAASITLIAITLARILGREFHQQSSVPFGPGLCFAGAIVFLFGAQLSFL